MMMKFFIVTAVLTLILAGINYSGIAQISLLIILTPIFIGTVVIVSRSLMQIGILIAIWAIIYLFVISKGYLF